VNSVEDGEDALDKLFIIEADIKHQAGSSLVEVIRFGNDLLQERFEFSVEVKATIADLEALFVTLNSSSHTKRSTLENCLQEQKDINHGLCKAFADHVKTFTDYMKSLKAAISDEKASLEDILAAVVNQLEEKQASGQLAAIDEASQKIINRNLLHNPLTPITLGDVQAQWSQYGSLLLKKKAVLEEQLDAKKRSGLTVEQVEEINHNFAYFDANKNGVLSMGEMRTLLQSLGEDSGRVHVQKIFDEFDQKKKGNLDHSEFMQFMTANLGDSDAAEEIIKSFKYLSFDRPIISDKELSSVVNQKTWKDDHVEYLIKDMPAKDGGYDYESWTSTVFAR